MNVIFISECTKDSLKTTRKILDNFAQRIGERSWKTRITQDGLNTVYLLLKASAKKTTAISCFWCRGRNINDIIWTVGKKNYFDFYGSVPTNVKKTSHMNKENPWYTGKIITLLSEAAGLFHDIGKASIAFQKKISNNPKKINHLMSNDIRNVSVLRHEWVSAYLLQSAYKKHKENSEPMLGIIDSLFCLDAVKNEKEILRTKIFTGVSGSLTLMDAIIWLVLTHHRIPTVPVIDGDIQKRLGEKGAEITADMEYGLTDVTPNWINVINLSVKEKSTTLIEELTFKDEHNKFLPIEYAEFNKIFNNIKNATSNEVQKNKYNFNSHFILHVSRMALMLADHYYSGLTNKNDRIFVASIKGQKESKIIYANTKNGKFNQPLVEHLIGVSLYAKKIAEHLPFVKECLPALNLKNIKSLNALSNKKSTDNKFNWQEYSYDKAREFSNEAKEKGAFIINLASTGKGKTLANLKIMAGLSDNNKLRCTIAIGLRTLTLQTGIQLRRLLELDESSVGVQIGGILNEATYEKKFNESRFEGSESIGTVSDTEEDNYIDFNEQEFNEQANNVFKVIKPNKYISKLVSAPVLACTIDHLIPATDSLRGGWQIGPMLRLLSSELILDEPDDFNLSDMPAVARLVQFAGMLGSKVLISSATITQDIALGLFLAYKKGREEYIYATRGIKDTNSIEVPCIWVDEFEQTGEIVTENFLEKHKKFTELRCEHIKKTNDTNKHIASIINVDKIKNKEDFANQIIHQTINLHEKWKSKFNKNYNVSFGLIRIAHIKTIIEITRALLENQDICFNNKYMINLCIYHSGFPLYIRGLIEKELDIVLNRKNQERNVLIDRQIKKNPEKCEQIFLVIASPISEVGRDHDYDYAIVEPSSFRSIVQIAGRVWRHRTDKENTEKTPNMVIFDKNYKGIKNDEITFKNPGFEDSYHLIKDKKCGLINNQDSIIINSTNRVHYGKSTPEIIKNKKIFSSLIDLEHFQIKRNMVFSKENADKFYAFNWQSDQSKSLPLLGLYQQMTPFRHATFKKDKYFLKLNRDYSLHELGWNLIPYLPDSTIDTSSGIQNNFIRYEEYKIKNRQFTDWNMFDWVHILKENREKNGWDKKNMQVDIDTASDRQTNWNEWFGFWN